MRHTLFHIPHELFGQPLFGFGLLLIVWIVFSLALLGWLVRRQGFNSETLGYLPVLILIGVAIAFLIPMLEEVTVRGVTLGLPIRGYGVMLMLGTITGVSLATYRARQLGLDSEVIFSLAFWMFLFGIAGARLLYVLLNLSDFSKDTLLQSLFSIFSVTEGGLVVLGSLIGALLAAWFFLRQRKVSPLAIGDIIAPSMLLGLALGRIGCLLNGCCFGGVCEAPNPFHLFAIRFPKANQQLNTGASPPYIHQRSLGQFHGIYLGEKPNPDNETISLPYILKVEPNTKAAASGIKAGEIIRRINGLSVNSFNEAQQVLLLDSSGPDITIETNASKEPYSWSIGRLPSSSRPVHPTQIYSAINAVLMCFFLWVYFPFRRRDGEVFAIMLMFYPIARTLLEIIRNDEPGRFGTTITISQWGSGVMLLAGVVLWIYLSRQAPHLQYPESKAATN